MADALDQAFNTLVSEVRQSNNDLTQGPQYPQAEVELPIGLIYCELKITCKKCKSTYYAPNAKLLLRYKNNVIKHVKEWTGVFNNLTREKMVYPLEAPTCSNCFDESNWDKGEFNEETKQ